MDEVTEAMCERILDILHDPITGVPHIELRELGQKLYDQLTIPFSRSDAAKTHGRKPWSLREFIAHHSPALFFLYAEQGVVCTAEQREKDVQEEVARLAASARELCSDVKERREEEAATDALRKLMENQGQAVARFTSRFNKRGMMACLMAWRDYVAMELDKRNSHKLAVIGKNTNFRLLPSPSVSPSLRSLSP